MVVFAYDLDDPRHLTVGAVESTDVPVYYLQAGQANTLVTMHITEAHVDALARAMRAILDDLGRRQPHRFTAFDGAIRDMRLRSPLILAFRITHVGLGYDEDRDRITLLFQGLRDDATLVLARILVSRPQSLNWCIHALRIIPGSDSRCVQGLTPCRFRDGRGRCRFCPKRN
ncbi:MAG: DUF3090 family protein [Blastochloris sp.]|nr:DUF3090 family protein [Blastochloris sp.]